MNERRVANRLEAVRREIIIGNAIKKKRKRKEKTRVHAFVRVIATLDDPAS